MADVKISQLPQASLPLTGSEVFPLVQNGVTVQAPVATTGNLSSISALRSSTPSNGVYATVEGYYAPGDGGGGQFYGVSGAASGTYVDNGGTIIVPTGGNGSSAWLRNYSGAINVKWFGVKGDNLTDDTTRLIAVFSAASNASVFFPAGTYLLSNNLGISTQTYVFGAGKGKTIINQINPTNTCAFFLNNVSKVTITDMSFTTNATGVVSSSGSIRLDNSTHCIIQNCEFYNYIFAAVWLNSNSNYNIVQNNWMHDAIVSTGAQADIQVGYYSYCEGNKILNNYVDGRNNDVGIQIIGGDGTTAFNTTVSGNYVGQHNGYGIIDYGWGNTRSIITNNYIENIQGSNNAAKGAGIYIVGTGGQIITNNTIVNCCVQTSVLSLAPGGIGISGPSDPDLEGIVVSGNSISNMTRFFGVYIFNRQNVTVANNIIEMPSTTYVTSIGIYLNNCRKCDVSNNTVKLSSELTDTTTGLFVRGSTIAIEGVQISGNTISGGNATAFRVSADGALVTGQNISVVGNSVITGTSNSISYNFGYMNNLTVSNNTFNGSSTNCGTINFCLNARFTNNNFVGTSTKFIVASGTCTGSYMDRTNYWNPAVATPTVSGTGLKIEFFASAAPVTGSWSVGSTAIQSAPAVGQPNGWVCTVGGTAGTWVALANL